MKYGDTHSKMTKVSTWFTDFTWLYNPPSHTFFKNFWVRRHLGWLELLHSFWSFNIYHIWLVYYGMARSQTNYCFFLPLISTQDQMFNPNTTQRLHVDHLTSRYLSETRSAYTSWTPSFLLCKMDQAAYVFHFTSWVVDLSLGHLTTLLISLVSHG